MIRSEYHTYLASREWAVKREAIKARSDGRCERCGQRDDIAVHHLTYERLGQEDLDDLQGVCQKCHEYLSGKREDDPARDMPIRRKLLLSDDCSELWLETQPGSYFVLFQTSKKEKLADAIAVLTGDLMQLYRRLRPFRGIGVDV